MDKVKRPTDSDSPDWQSGRMPDKSALSIDLDDILSATSQSSETASRRNVIQDTEPEDRASNNGSDENDDLFDDEDEIEFDSDEDDSESKPTAKKKKSKSSKKKQKQSDEEDYDEDEDEERCINVASIISENSGKLIVALVVIGICLLLIGISSCSQNSGSIPTEKPVKVETVEKIVEKVETVTVWDTKAEMLYDEYVDIPEKYYTDEMVISKFILQDGSSRTYYFSGIPKNFKRKVVFPVTYSEYNKVASGGKIYIDYKIDNIDGKDVIVSIITSVKE